VNVISNTFTTPEGLFIAKIPLPLKGNRYNIVLANVIWRETCKNREDKRGKLKKINEELQRKGSVDVSS
jgi:hypothetical protein